MSMLKNAAVDLLSKLEGVDPKKHPQIRASLALFNSKRLVIQDIPSHKETLDEFFATIFYPLYPELQTEENAKRVAKYEREVKKISQAPIQTSQTSTPNTRKST